MTGEKATHLKVRKEIDFLGYRWVVGFFGAINQTAYLPSMKIGEKVLAEFQDAYLGTFREQTGYGEI